VDLRTTGGESLSALAARCRRADKALLGDMRKGVAKAVKPLGDAVTAGVGRYMPGGYAPVLSRSLRHRVAQRATGAGFTVTLTTYAEGKTERRRIIELNRGTLRHPLYGNRARWYAQKVKPGFWSKPIEEGMPRVTQEVADVMRQTVRKVAG
jgi:hypothetical protein